MREIIVIVVLTFTFLCDSSAKCDICHIKNDRKRGSRLAAHEGVVLQLFGFVKVRLYGNEAVSLEKSIIPQVCE